MKRTETEKGKDGKRVVIHSLISNERKVIDLNAKRKRVTKANDTQTKPPRVRVDKLLGGRKQISPEDISPEDLRHEKLEVMRDEYLKETGSLMPLEYFRRKLDRCENRGVCTPINGWKDC